MKNQYFKKMDKTADTYSKMYDFLVSQGNFEKAFKIACELDQKMSDLGVDVVKLYSKNCGAE